MNTRRSLARAIVALSKGGTPLRHARGVVVSSTVGTSVITIDGGSTNITAFNYRHSQSFPAGTVVDCLLSGNKAYILGCYDNDVPIGGLAGSGSGPSTATNYSTQATVCTVAINAVTGHQYLVTGWAFGGQSTTSGITTIAASCTDSGGLAPTNLRIISETVAASATVTGAASWLYTATTTGSVTFTVTCATSAGTFGINPHNVTLIVARVG